jgi:hyperosmotically inducible periplasmic protein
MKSAFSVSWVLVGAFILGLAGCASSGGTGKKTGEFVDDAWITTKVKSEMIADGDVKAHKIDVDTKNGVVKLTGTVETWQEANKATDIARGIKGVTAVENEIRVQ